MLRLGSGRSMGLTVLGALVVAAACNDTPNVAGAGDAGEAALAGESGSQSGSGPITSGGASAEAGGGGARPAGGDAGEQVAGAGGMPTVAGAPPEGYAGHAGDAGTAHADCAAQPCNSAGAAPTYDSIDLTTEVSGVPTDEPSSGVAINEQGHVLVRTSCRAFLLSPVGTREIEPLSTGDCVRANGLNDLDEVVGVSGEAPFIWHDGNSSPLDGLTQGEAMGINNSGQVIVRDTNLGNGVLWDDGSATVLELPGNEGFIPIDLNNVGLILGTDLSELDFWLLQGPTATDLALGRAYALNNAGNVTMRQSISEPAPGVVSPNGTFTSLQVQNYVGADSFDTSYMDLWAINDAGVIVGSGHDPEATLAFVFDHGTLHVLGRGEARGINEQGEVIGTRALTAAAPTGEPSLENGRAALWTTGCARLCHEAR